jgi:hypothetical protein
LDRAEAEHERARSQAELAKRPAAAGHRNRHWSGHRRTQAR